MLEKNYENLIFIKYSLGRI